MTDAEFWPYLLSWGLCGVQGMAVVGACVIVYLVTAAMVKLRRIRMHDAMNRREHETMRRAIKKGIAPKLPSVTSAPAPKTLGSGTQAKMPKPSKQDKVINGRFK